MFLQALLLFFSFVILYLGAEMALNSAEKIGKCIGLSPLVIGSLIIGFGTSMPEFFVSQLACYRDHVDIALGNILGSNIANIFLVLGITALIVPLRTHYPAIRKQFVTHLFLVLLLFGVFYFSNLGLLPSILLLLFFTYYVFETFRQMKKARQMREKAEDDAHQVHHSESRDKRYATVKIMTYVKLLAGFVFIYFGGELLVGSGSKLAVMIGVPEYVISVIFIAFGTSFPELATAVVACLKRKDIDLIIGNIIGSNIFNAAFVLGTLGVYNIAIPKKFTMELSSLLLISVLLLTLSFLRRPIVRWMGVLFLLAYGGIITLWVI